MSWWYLVEVGDDVVVGLVDGCPVFSWDFGSVFVGCAGDNVFDEDVVVRELE